MFVLPVLSSHEFCSFTLWVTILTLVSFSDICFRPSIACLEEPLAVLESSRFLLIRFISFVSYVCRVHSTGKPQPMRRYHTEINLFCNLYTRLIINV